METVPVTEIELISYINMMSQQKMRESEEKTFSFLIGLPLFTNFDVDELTVLSRHMSFLHLQRGEHLFLEGDPGTFMGFVVNGLFEVQKNKDNGEKIILAELTKGRTIGEMALIDKSPRSATVVARQASTMVTLTDKGFDILADKHPSLAIKLIRKIVGLLSMNMRRTSNELVDLMDSTLRCK